MTSIAGLSGELRLAEITFRAVGQAGEASAPDVAVVTFTDPGGGPLSVDAQDGEVCLIPCAVACYDLDESGAVDVGDVTLIAGAWRARDAASLAAYDFNGNGVVDVEDINWSRGAGTC